MINERLAEILIDSFWEILIPGLTMTIPLTILAFSLAMVGDSSYHGHGTVCRDKNTEEGGAVLHMGDPRDPSFGSTVCCFLWSAKHRNIDRTIPGGCTCLFHQRRGIRMQT